MHRLSAAPALLALAACSTGPLEPTALRADSDPEAVIPSASPSAEAGVATLGAAVPEAASTESIDAEELDTGLVCETEKRPGSRIEETYCYSREEHAANREARDKQVKRQMGALALEQEQMRERELLRGRAFGKPVP